MSPSTTAIPTVLGRKAPLNATYSAWEKGSIERHNRLLRLYCPKSTNFSKLSPRALKQTHRLIVHYPHSPKKVS